MTDVRLVKDCGLYPSYKKIIDFTGTKAQIISKQLAWIDTKTHITVEDVNYNKAQNKLVLPIDYEEALTYTYAVLTDLSGSDSTRPLFMFVNEVSNLSGGDDSAEPSVAFTLSLDPIMTFMGEWELDECMINRSHEDRWISGSDLPSRITPNVESVTGYANYKSISRLIKYLNNQEIVYICVAFTSNALETNRWGYRTTDPEPVVNDKLYYGIFPVYVGNRTSHIQGVFGVNTYRDVDGVYTATHEAYECWYPSIEEVIDGSFMDSFDIATSDIVSISIIPTIPWDVSYSRNSASFTVEQWTPGQTSGSEYTYSDSIEYVSGHSGRCYYINDVPVIYRSSFDIGSSLGTIYYRNTYTRVMTNFTVIGSDNNISISNLTEKSRMMQLFDAEDLVDGATTLDVYISIPVKPTDGNIASSQYEPALYFAPYMKRYISDGKGQQYLELPDNVVFNNIGVNGLILRAKQFMDGSNNSTLYYLSSDIVNSGILGSSCIIPNDNLYVVNDAWKEYVLTRKDTDRQMVTNYSIKNAVDNLIYMSYGGALVGSRSAGEEGYIDRTPVQRVQRRVNGRFASGFDEIGGNPYLTATGKRVIGAIGLAAGASIVTSLVDAHTSWINQMEKEKQIQNQPSGLLQTGGGQSMLTGNLPYHAVEEVVVDDVAFNRAYENFRKYGYWIYRFDIPDTQSRKYFNYLLTNGAIVKGAINQEIRDTIASIFDAGVTIFHYDSGDNTYTRNLEYTDKENIEVSLI